MTDPATEAARHAAALELEILSGLLRSPSGVQPDEWRRALIGVKPRTARCLVLYFLHDMTQEQIAEYIPVSTRQRAYQLIQQGLRLLRTKPNIDTLLGGGHGRQPND